MKIFITGAEGFIGSHLTEKLVKLGHYVKALVLYNSFNSCGWLEDLNKKKNKNLDIVYGDVRDENFIYNQTKKIDAIFHLAALISIPYSYNSYHSFVDTNINGTINILSSAKRNKTKKVFITSTSEVYGTAEYTPIDEKHPLNPQSPYSASKIAADNLALSYYYSFKTPVTLIRPFNTFGPRQSERAIIPSIINQILRSKDNSISLGNLYPRREFNFVEDVCEGYYKALNKNNFGETINIGNGYDISIKELVKLISQIMDRKIKIKQISNRKRLINSEIDLLKSDFSKAKNILNWKPSHPGRTGLIRALKKTIEWYRNNTSKDIDKTYII